MTSPWQNISDITIQNPPLIFNLAVDPSEAFPLDASTQEYQDAQMLIESAVLIHQSTLEIVPNQMVSHSTESDC